MTDKQKDGFVDKTVEGATKVAGSATQVAGKATKTTGTALQAAGKTAKYTGTGVQYAGTGMKYAGKGISAAGDGMVKAGSSLSSTGWGAIVGVPLSAVGAVASGTGKAAEAVGSGVEKTGEAVKKTGKAVDKAGKKTREVGKSIDDKGKQIKKTGGDFKANKDQLNFFKNKMSLKTKLIMIGAGILFSFLATVIFIVVLISPLIAIGVIDIEDMFGSHGGSGSSSSSSSSSGFTPISNSNTHYWPVGGSDITSEDGVNYAVGDPVSTVITTNYNSGTFDGIVISSNGNEAGVVNVIATKDGTVTYPTSSEQASYSDTGTSTDGDGHGNYVVISHNDGTSTMYANLAQNSITVSSGDTVKQGQVIGKMGSSGGASSVGLYFEIIVNGNGVDPTGYVSSSNPRPQGGTITVHNGVSNKQSVCLTLKSIGFSDNSVAALLTNINAESGFDPYALGDNGTSYGLCQWHNGRYDNLMASFPDSYSTIGSQIEYLMYELENTYVSVYNALVNGSSSANDLTYTFCSKFEIPADTENTCRARGNNSTGFYNYVTNGCN